MKRKIRKSTLMHWTNLISLTPVIMLAFSGILLQMIYHMQRHQDSFEYWGLNKSEWSLVHKVNAILCLLLIGYHLYLHWKWLKNAVKKWMIVNGQLVKKNSLWLSIVWIIAMITSMISWVLIEDRQQARGIIEIHDKLGIILVVLIIIHFVQHFSWLKKLFRGNPNNNAKAKEKGQPATMLVRGSGQHVLSELRKKSKN